MRLRRQVFEVWVRWLVSVATRRDAAREVADVLAALTLILAAAALAMGAQHLPVLIAVALATAATTTVTMRRFGMRLGAPGALCLLLATWTLIQIIPLPLSTLRSIAPKNASIWEQAYALTQSNRTWGSISLDPGASWVEALKWTTYGAAAATTGAIVRKIGVKSIAGVTFGLALCVAVVTLLHGLLRAHAVYGFIVPSFDPGPWGLGPFLNGNNLSGYLNLGAISGLALLASRQHRGPRWPLALGVGALIAASLLARSRGGIASLLLVSLLLVVKLERRDRTGRRRRVPFYKRTSFAPTLTILGGITLALFSADVDSWLKMREESMLKVHMLGWEVPMFSDFPLFGIGRGAFETIFPSYRQTGTHEIYHHAEDFIVQWPVEWGGLVAIPALLAFAWMVRPIHREGTSRSVFRLALGVLLLQNLVDHALEMPAIGLLTSVVVSALAVGAERQRETAGAESQPPEAGSASAGIFGKLGPSAFAAVILVLGVASVAWGRHAARLDRANLSQTLRSLPADDLDAREGAMAETRTAVNRHPGDPFLPQIGALLARRIPGERPLRWIGFAMSRDVMSGRNHLALAFFLAGAHANEQSLTELRSAVERDQSLGFQAAKWASLIAQNLNEALLAVPDGPAGTLELLSFSENGRYAPQRIALAEEASRRDPDLPRAHAATASAIINDLSGPGGAICTLAGRDICLKGAAAHISSLARLEPADPTATELTARLLAATGRIAEARALLSSECSAFARPAGCWIVRVELGQDEVAGAEYRDALRSYYESACATPTSCLNAGVRLGGILESRGDQLGALEYYGRAVRAGGSSRSLWTKIARVAHAAGQPKRAEEAIKRARSFGEVSTDPELEHQLDTEAQAQAVAPESAVQ